MTIYMTLEKDNCYNENCLDTMLRLPDGFVDLIITSPPYDGLRSYNGYSFDFEPIAKELYRIIKPNGVIVWIVGDSTVKGSESGTSFKQALFFKEIGFSLHDTMIYQKIHYLPLTHRRYEQTFEFMFVFSKGTPKTFNPLLLPCINAGKTKAYRNNVKFTEKNMGERLRDEKTRTKDTKIKGNIWEYNTGFSSGDDSTMHPAPFPEQLVHDHIVSWSNPGDLVYDPFMGSGTVAKVAKLTNRQWLGSEISAEYCQIILDRLSQL